MGVEKKRDLHNYFTNPVGKQRNYRRWTVPTAAAEV